MSPIYPSARNSNIIVQEIGNETLIYDLQADKAFNLNETSAFIWHACNGEQSLSIIAAQISEKFSSTIEADFVWLAIQQFKKHNLLENADEICLEFNGLTRREIIRKIGFASMITLPVVTSLVAPTAIHAQSCVASSSRRPLGCPCTAITECQPPGDRCCSNVPGYPRICVTKGLQSPGQPCGVHCDCDSGVCLTTSPRVCQ